MTDPPATYWEARIDSRSLGDHVLVIDDEVSGVSGYAYSAAYRPRAAYSKTRETSIYLAPDAVGAGLGTLLYSELLTALRQGGTHSAVAVIALPNTRSVALHERLGFQLVGTMREVGHKFERWVDTSWYQLLL